MQKGHLGIKAMQRAEKNETIPLEFFIVRCFGQGQFKVFLFICNCFGIQQLSNLLVKPGNANANVTTGKTRK
jgi:hypothetical protein